MELKVFRLTDKVWFGRRPERDEWDNLFNQGVSAVVNLQIEDVDNFQMLNPVAFLWLPSIDGILPLETLAIGAAFISLMEKSNYCVFVHCRVAANRTPQMLSAYLIKSGCTVEAAIQTVRAVRPEFNPKEDVLSNLHAFEAEFRQ